VIENYALKYAASHDMLIAIRPIEGASLRIITKNPFSDSKADLEKWGSPDDCAGSFDPYYRGEKGFILDTDEIEPDDKYHLPADDDDEVQKARSSDHFRRNFGSP
jgi:hypothetical protein